MALGLDFFFFFGNVPVLTNCWYIWATIYVQEIYLNRSKQLGDVHSAYIMSTRYLFFLYFWVP